MKTMRDMIAKLQDGYKKSMQCMWILNIKWCKKNRLVKYLKTENFSVSISQASIEYQSSQANVRLEKSGIFRLIKNHTWSIENLEKPKFWKTKQFYTKTPQSIVFINKMHEYEMKCFSKTLVFNPDLPKSHFWSNFPQKLKH